ARHPAPAARVDDAVRTTHQLRRVLLPGLSVVRLAPAGRGRESVVHRAVAPFAGLPTLRPALLPDGERGPLRVQPSVLRRTVGGLRGGGQEADPAALAGVGDVFVPVLDQPWGARTGRACRAAGDRVP